MPVDRTVVVPEGVAPPQAHYSHGVIASGRFLFVAGQVAVDEHGELVGIGDAAAQARQVLVNLSRVVEAAGGDLADAVRATVYLTRLADRGPVGRCAVSSFRETRRPTPCWWSPR